MQSFLEARSEVESVVLQVVHGGHARLFGSDLALQGAAIGGVDPITNDGAVSLVNEEHPAFDVLGLVRAANREFVGTYVVVGEVVLVHLSVESVEREETFAERLKLPVDVDGPTLRFGAVVPVLSGLDVPEAVGAVAVVVGFVVAYLHVGFLAVVGRIGEGDEVVVRWRIEFVSVREGLCFWFFKFFNDGSNIRNLDRELGYGFHIATAGLERAFSFFQGDDLNLVEILSSHLEVDDFFA